MPIGDSFVFNHVKAKMGYYVEQARDTSAEINCLLLMAAGMEPPDAMADKTTVAGLLSSTNDEATFPNYARRQLAAPTLTVDNTGNRVVASLSGVPPLTIRWDNAGAGSPVVQQSVGKIVFYYDPNPAGPTPDSGLLLLSAAPIGATTDGTHLVVTLGTDGIAVWRDPA